MKSYDSHSSCKDFDHWADFIEWRADVDCDNLLDIFDLALGFFSGRGLNHKLALHFAEKARDLYLRGAFKKDE